jgi:hypothetical protein
MLTGLMRFGRKGSWKFCPARTDVVEGLNSLEQMAAGNSHDESWPGSTIKAFAPAGEAGVFTSRLDSLDRLQVHRAGLAVPVRASIIRQTLTDRGGGLLGIPGDRASFEAEILATGFRLDQAMARIVIERIDSAKKCHAEFLCSDAKIGIGLGDDKDGGRCGLAPKTVDCDW